MRIVTPIAPIVGVGSLFDPNTGEFAPLKPQNIEAVAIVIDDDLNEHPFYLVNVRDGSDVFPSFVHSIET